MVIFMSKIKGYIIDCDYLIEVPHCSYPRPKLRKNKENKNLPAIISIDIGNMQ